MSGEYNQFVSKMREVKNSRCWLCVESFANWVADAQIVFSIRVAIRKFELVREIMGVEQK